MDRFRYLIDHDLEFEKTLKRITAENFGLNMQLEAVECLKLGCDNCILESQSLKDDSPSCRSLMAEYIERKMIKNGELVVYKDKHALFIEYLFDSPGFCRIKIEDNGKMKVITVLISEVKPFTWFDVRKKVLKDGK